MQFFDSVFTALLSREQRERVSRNSWDKSVAQAAAVLDQEKVVLQTPRNTTPVAAISVDRPISCAMAPSLSASSSRSSSYSNSPPRPEFRRHLSIARAPISYDALMASKPSGTIARRASNEAAPYTHQLLYSLPPLGPMQGIGKYRRSVDVTEDFLENIQRNTIEALQPLIQCDDRVSRFRRGDLRDTTTPPRAYSTSPPIGRQLAMQNDLVRLANELEAAQVQPIIEDLDDVPASAKGSTR